MKKLFAGIVLSLAAAVAFALPRPSQIEDALAARDYQSARSMTQQVLDEKPNSARAHLFNAYILLKADRNPSAASEELKTARRLDHNGDVKNSSLFGRTASEIENFRQPRAERREVVRERPAPVYVAPAVQTSAYEPVVLKKESSGLGFWGWTLVILTAAGLAWFVFVYLPKRKAERREQARKELEKHDRELRREMNRLVQRQEPVTRPSSRLSSSAYPSRSSGPAAFASPAPAPAAAPSTTVINNTSHSSGNDMMTGMLLGHALSSHGSHHHHHSHGSSYEREPVRETYREPEPARSTDYETSRSSYSSGKDDSWSGSSSSSSSSGSDSWGSSSSSSSSWDSGSSSSSYDSGSSGGSDW